MNPRGIFRVTAQVRTGPPVVSHQDNLEPALVGSIRNVFHLFEPTHVRVEFRAFHPNPRRGHDILDLRPSALVAATLDGHVFQGDWKELVDVDGPSGLYGEAPEGFDPESILTACQQALEAL